jgi:hypothetical protein
MLGEGGWQGGAVENEVLEGYMYEDDHMMEL